MSVAPRFLFVPVSGPGGAGEYFRSLALARAFERHWPGCTIRFVLNAAAPYAREAPYTGLLLEDSPTRSNAAVVEYLARERPDVVLFDSSGRLAQYRAARQAGARVVYVSSRPKTRWKGFRIRRMRALDQHWIAQPQALGGAPNAWERLKLRAVGSPELVFLDTMHDDLDFDGAHELQVRLGLQPGQYVVFCPGGGGTFGPGTDAVDVFREAAAIVARETGTNVVLVTGHRRTESVAGGSPTLRTVSFLPQGVLLALLRESAVSAVNGGSLLLQSMAQGVALVAAPIAGDQSDRIRRSANLGCVTAAGLEAGSLAAAVLRLLRDDAARRRQRESLERLALRNGTATAVKAVESVLGRTATHTEVCR